MFSTSGITFIIFHPIQRFSRIFCRPKALFCTRPFCTEYCPRGDIVRKRLGENSDYIRFREDFIANQINVIALLRS
ncbi:MAG TPA: hypothetical protein DEQ68_00025 [Ruminococcaceae bacterium]|nr:hypothetical protein [Oscillospiraceae bacterium]